MGAVIIIIIITIIIIVWLLMDISVVGSQRRGVGSWVNRVVDMVKRGK